MQERQCVLGLRELVEEHDARAGMGLAQPVGDLDALVGLRRRHADVRQHDVGLVLVDGGEQRREVTAGRHDRDVVVIGQELRDPLADEDAVLGDGDAHGHFATVPRGV